MDDSTLEPLLNAAALANDSVEQLIQPFTAAAASWATGGDDNEEEPPTKKRVAKKKTSLINLNSLQLNHPNSDTHKLQTNQLLLETASRIEDAISELSAYANLLAAEGSVLQHRKNGNSRSSAANNIRNSIVPLLQITADTLRDAGKCFAPFGGTLRLQERNDNERRKKLMEGSNSNNDVVVAAGINGGAEQSDDAAEGSSSSPQKSPALIMIDDFVKRSNWSPPPPSAVGKKEKGKATPMTSASQKKRKLTATAAASSKSNTHSITLLKPRNGTIYTKSEAIAIARQCKKGDGRYRIFQAMIQQGFVPVNQRSLRRLVNRVEDGEFLLDDEWTTGRGRPSKAYPEEMKPKPVDCNLTFDDLDTGDNRIVVEVGKKKRQKTTKNDDEDEDEVGDTDDDSCAAAAAADDDDDDDDGSQKQKSVPSPPKKKKIQKVDPKVVAFEVPPPRDGSKLYKKSEFVEVTKTFIATNQKNIAMRAMMHRGYVGTSQMRTLRRLLDKDGRGEPIQDTEWCRGRPPIVSSDEINDIVEMIKREDLRVYDTDGVNQLLVQAIMKRRGVVDGTKLKFSDRSLNDYFTVLKSKLSPLYWKKLDDE